MTIANDTYLPKKSVYTFYKPKCSIFFTIIYMFVSNKLLPTVHLYKYVPMRRVIHFSSLCCFVIVFFNLPYCLKYHLIITFFNSTFLLSVHKEERRTHKVVVAVYITTMFVRPSFGLCCLVFLPLVYLWFSFNGFQSSCCCSFWTSFSKM